MKSTFSTFRGLVVGASLMLAGGLEAAQELSLIRANFDNLGVDTEARGVARAIFHPNSAKFRLDLSGLTPDATYQLSIDGILEDTFTADRRGGVHADFRVGGTGTKRALDFDPRGAVVSILDETEEVLSVVFSGDGEPDDIRVDERTTLLPLDETESGRVSLRYLEQKNQDRFIVHFNGLERGSYEFFVDGQLQAEIDLTKGRSTMRTFDLGKNSHAKKTIKGSKNPKRLDLDFDPRGLIVDVVRDGEIIFSGEMLAQIPALEEQLGEATLDLTNSGEDTDATASVLIRSELDGELLLQVQVGALDPGTYDIVIGGAIEGSVTVTGLEPDGLATVVFSTEPGAGEFLLDFDIFGETIEIRQGATVYFNGTLPLTITELPLPTVVETELPLLNQGVNATANGHITLTTNGTTLEAVEVDLAGVPAGNYDFRVGTEVQGTIVVADVNGVLVGELRFASDAEPLDFDPAGLTVTIEQAGTILLSRPL